MNAIDPRLGRAYRAAERRAVRRLSSAIASQVAGDVRSWTAAERTADAIAARIATIRDPRSAAVYRADNGLAHRAARLALGMER